MSNWSSKLLREVPSPNPERSAYARFIPREELASFESWSPDMIGRAAAKPTAAPAPAAPPEPDAAEWQRRIEAARRAGYEQGYREGTSALEGFKRSHAQQMQAELEAFVAAIDAEFDALHEQIAPQVATVATRLARQVVRHELATMPQLVGQVAAQAVESLVLSARHVRVHVHPLDLPLVAEAAAQTLVARGARLLPDAQLARGGCRVDSDCGSVDVRIEERWAQAAASLGSTLAYVDDTDDATVDATADAGAAADAVAPAAFDGAAEEAAA